MKILIVDDERLILMGLKAVIGKIEDLSCEVQTAMSGEQAALLLEENPVDLMITDVEMPGMSGLDLVEKAKNKGWCRHFMILSGYDKFEYARRALRLDAADYLLKPVDKEELRRDICRIARELEDEGKKEPNLLKEYECYFPHLKERSDSGTTAEKCSVYPGKLSGCHFTFHAGRAHRKNRKLSEQPF